MQTKLTQLVNELTKLAQNGGLCIAFSGGCDSTFLLKAACTACDNTHAVTLYTPFHTSTEPQAAARIAGEIGAAFHLITLPAFSVEIMQNPPDRCYLCKKEIFTQILAYASERCLTVLDGTNADDLHEDRPGLRALKELGIHSPLAQLGITKAEVRAFSRELGLSTADVPAAPCLATRIPHNTRIEPQILQKIAAIENCIRALGPKIVRARAESGAIRIEALPQDFAVIAASSQALAQKAAELGFSHISLDLKGYGQK